MRSTPRTTPILPTPSRKRRTFLEEIGDKKYTIQRSKGLGENDPEMMWLTTMNPESRRLIKVLPTDVEETARVFDLLLGDNLAGRKEHIAAARRGVSGRSGRILMTDGHPHASEDGLRHPATAAALK